MVPLSDLRLPAEPGTVAFVRDLATHGHRPALIDDDGALSYLDLAARVAETERRLGPHRRLVLIAGGNTADAIVTYLGALAGGHPVLLVPGAEPVIESLVTAYDPDVVVRPAGRRWTFDERRAISAHDPHPELALLLSTSGSTGSPKLVRLSHDNLQSNAAAIAGYLDIRPGDRAATTLPMHYCYGLSVINSHLHRGAALILTDLSVADSCFWKLFRAHRGTSFAGVPYTFDLLDRIDFAGMRLPHLRYVTQAGGRLAPDRVARYAALGRRDGWELFVMYGQTEATARMAYLPPSLAHARPDAVGVPIPGGSFRLAPLLDAPAGTGELVYTGPNVMLGYAETPADLALGRTVEELRTGDIARRAPDGLYEIVGRRSRFAKILGLRIDPVWIETLLARQGIESCCAGADDELVVAVRGDLDPAYVRRLVAADSGVPARAVTVLVLPELPRLRTAKPDYRAVLDLARKRAASVAAPVAPAAQAAPAAPATTDTGDLRRLYAEILDRADVTDDSSFVGLGGDSLSYVEVSVRLEQALGHLPVDWHVRPIRDLRPAPPAPSAPRRRTRRLETSVALRAIAIVLIVGTHAGLFNISGGAHLLLGVAGFNFARFRLTTADRRERVRHIWRSAGRIAVPSVVWIAAIMAVTGAYHPANLALLGGVFGADADGSGWHFWFIEALVYLLVILAVLLSIPAVDRLERRLPYALPLAVLGLGLITRYDLPGWRAHDPPSVVWTFWLFALGWATAKATTVRQRLLVTAAALAIVPGFFGDPAREAVIAAGLVLLVWVPTVPSLGPVNQTAAVLAGGSLYIYLTHWQVYPRLDHHNALLAVVASLAVGLAYATVAGWVARQARARRARVGQR